MKKIILLVFITALFINSTAYAGKLELDFSEKTPFNASVRSALMPGWGQSWNDQPVKAWITFGVFAASVVGAFYFNEQAFDKYEKYEEQGIIDGKHYDEYESDYNTSQILTFVAIGTWLYAVIDAYFVCKKQVANTSPLASSFKLHYDQKNNGYFLTYSKKFDI
jgi:hypothetical protein